MTEATAPDVEDLSRRIAARGRVALVERLRTAYRDAASAHADIVSLEDARLEALIQNAADHADGLQWRRALAGLVAQELGVSVAEALSHPAVVRAQSLVGAPSYEQSLAELITRPIPPPLPPRGVYEEDPDGPPRPIDGQLQLEDERGTQPEDMPSEELEAALADDTIVELLPQPDPSFELDEVPHDTVADATDGELQYHPAPGPHAQDEAVDAVVVEPEAADVDVEGAPAATAPASEEPNPPDPESEPDASAEPDASGGPHTGAEPDAGAEPAAGAEQDAGAEPAAGAEQDAGAEAEASGGPHTGAEPDAQAEPDAGLDELRVPAIHLGGVANLPTGSEGLDLRLSEQGLDIMRGPDTIIGRLPWQEIEALEVPAQRRRRRSTALGARLVVRTQQGDASFEIPGYSNEELRERVELRLDHYRQLSQR